MLADLADIQTHIVFMAVSFYVLNYSWRGFSSASVLQNHLLAGFELSKDACFVTANTVQFFSCKE